MILEIVERLMCLGLLPEEGNISTMRMRNALIMKVGLSAEEVEEYGVTGLDTGEVRWNPGSHAKEIEFNLSEIILIRTKLEALEKDEKLTPHHVELYGKFVDEKIE